MRLRVLTTKLRVEIKNETRVFLESLVFEIDMKVLQKSGLQKRLCQLLVLKKFLNSTVEFRINVSGHKIWAPSAKYAQMMPKISVNFQEILQDDS